jgi:hypothetical protein
MIKYYPQTLSISEMIRKSPEMGLVDLAEKQRLKDVEDKKARGKGAPKKAKTKGGFLYTVAGLVVDVFQIQRTVVVRTGNGSNEAVSTSHYNSYNCSLIRRWTAGYVHYSGLR